MRDKKDELLNYSMNFSPTDIIIKKDNNFLFLNEEAAFRAIEVAYKLHKGSMVRAAEILICKIADGYRLYEHEMKKFKEEHGV